MADSVNTEQLEVEMSWRYVGVEGTDKPVRRGKQKVHPVEDIWISSLISANGFLKKICI